MPLSPTLSPEGESQASFYAFKAPQVPGNWLLFWPHLLTALPCLELHTRLWTCNCRNRPRSSLSLCHYTGKFISDLSRNFIHPWNPTLPSPSPWNLTWPTSHHHLQPNHSRICHASITVLITLPCNYLLAHAPTLLTTYVYFWGQRSCFLVQSINI